MPLEDVLFLLNRWLHLSAAIVAIGGALFMRAVLVPSVRATLTDEQRAALHEEVIGRWKLLAMISMAVLLVTGFVNFFMVSLPATKNDEEMAGLYHMIFGLKFMAALGVFFIASALTGKSKALEGIRAAAPKWLAIVVVLGLVIVAMAGMLGIMR